MIKKDVVALADALRVHNQTAHGRTELTSQNPATERVPGGHVVSLQLRYEAPSKLGLVRGLGQTRVMSSQDIVFAPAGGLEPGMSGEIVVDWPPGLDDGTHLELVLQVTITRSQDGQAEARIRAYDFRTGVAGFWG